MKNLKSLAIVLGAAMSLAPVAQARTLSPEEALQRLHQPGLQKKAPAHLDQSPQLVHTAVTLSGDPAVYLFNNSKGEGYMVVSADDAAYPLLGYSDSGEIPSEIPPQLQWWLDEYTAQIEYASARGEEESSLHRLAVARDRADRTAIAPMIATQWDQDAPYNNQCPMSGTERTYTGCVATAMAQVMNYWKYPQKGKGSISYNAETLQKRLSLNFSLRSFDWDNMLSDYEEGSYSDAEAEAVAYLMKACGYAVKMDYGLDSSGALAMFISRAMVKYFDYDQNINYVLRQHYSSPEWESMIYDNLKNVGPLLYGGGSLIGGGHSFICDGYDGNGYFHFNWGWTGMSDGYFSLEALNPYMLGTGGGSGGGYNFTQDAVLGIQPPTGKPLEVRNVELTQTGSLAGKVENDSLKFKLFAEQQAMWVNYMPETLKLKFGAIIEPQTGTPGDTRYTDISDKKLMLETGYGTAPEYIDAGIDLAAANLPDGTYKVTVATCEMEKESEVWVPVHPNYGYFNYVVLTRKGDEYTVVNEPVERLEVVTARVIGEIYYGLPATVEITVANGSDHEISSGFAPALTTDNQIMMLGESVYLSVPAHSEVVHQWTTDIYSLSQYFSVTTDTEMQLTFFDEKTYNVYAEDYFETVTVHPNPGLPTLSTVSKPVIVGAEMGTMTVGGKLDLYFKVTDKRNIPVRAKVKLDKGVFAYPLLACITSLSEAGELSLHTYNGSTTVISKAGDMYELETTLSFPAGVAGQTYYVMMGFGYGSQLVQIGPHFATFVIESAGVDDVKAADGCAISFDGETVTAQGSMIEVFSLQGVKMAEGADSVSVRDLPAGIYVARSNGSALKISVK